MHARRLRDVILLLTLAAGTVLVGCELIVDFDRTKIPIEDAGTTTDATPPPGPEDAGSDAADAADATDATDGADAADAADASDADHSG